jgi:hypothetical protein
MLPHPQKASKMKRPVLLKRRKLAATSNKSFLNWMARKKHSLETLRNSTKEQNYS